MVYAWAVIVVVLNAAWLGLIVLGLPGNWLMVGTALVAAWLTSRHPGDVALFGLPVLIVVFALAVLGEILELVAGAAGAKRGGGTRRGALGALVGGLVGALVGTFVIPVPIVGSLIGACLGAFAGAWGFELTGGREMDAAVRSGLGAGVGRLAGTVLKLVVGILIWVILAVAAFWP